MDCIEQKLDSGVTEMKKKWYFHLFFKFTTKSVDNNKAKSLKIPVR